MKYTVENVDKAVKNIQEKSDNALEICGEHLKKKIQEQLRADKRYDLGDLVGSIESRLVKHWLVEVWSGLVYAPVMEYGRKPWKFPPLNDLVGRTARKWMITWNVKTKYYNELYYKDRWVVFLIARAIAKKGIKGKHSFQTALDRERTNIKKLYIEQMQ